MAEKGKRILIVGGGAGGSACATRARRLSEEAEILLFERGPYVSYANCGLPYYVGNLIPSRENLLITTPDTFLQRFNISARTYQEVLRIDRENRFIEVKDLISGEVYQEPYDALVLATGAVPIRPSLPGMDHPGIFTVRTIPDVERIKDWIEQHQAQQAVVVGGGFIGLEMVENLVLKGLKVTLIEMLTQVMPPMDPEMVTPLHAHLSEKGVELVLGDGVARFEETKEGGLLVVTQSGGCYPADLVILSIGVRPDVRLAKEAGLEIGERGGIRVDAQMRTSDPFIWAVGDAVEIKDLITGQWTLVPLGGPANRQGRVAAEAIFGRADQFRGVLGTAIVKIFDQVAGIVGASEKTLKRLGIPYEKVYLHPYHHASYYPGAEPLQVKLLFSPDTGKVLGAQAVGKMGVDKFIDTIALALQMNATVDDLAEAELAYAPQFGSAKSPVNMVGFVAQNVLRGDHPIVHWEDLESLGQGGEKSPLFLDVRNPDEYEAGHIPGAINIPLSQLRYHLDQLPRDREIWVYCGVGQRGYYATRLLRQKGFLARNLSGGLRTFTAGQFGKGRIAVA